MAVVPICFLANLFHFLFLSLYTSPDKSEFDYWLLNSVRSQPTVCVANGKQTKYSYQANSHDRIHWLETCSRPLTNHVLLFSRLSPSFPWAAHSGVLCSSSSEDEWNSRHECGKCLMARGSGGENGDASLWLVPCQWRGGILCFCRFHGLIITWWGLLRFMSLT